MRGKESAFEFLQKIYGKYVTNSHDRIMNQANLLKRTITHANIPPWVTGICPYAFSGFENLERVNVPNLVLAIDEEAFSKCPKLSVVNIPDSVKGDNLGKGAFRNCTSLACIRLPPNLSVVNDETFKGCTSLKEVQLNSGLEMIGAEAFERCKSLQQVMIPASVKLIKTKAFQHTSIKKAFFKDGVPETEKKAFFFLVKKETY